MESVAVHIDVEEVSSVTANTETNSALIGHDRCGNTQSEIVANTAAAHAAET
jgi:hypothetical protein